MAHAKRFPNRLFGVLAPSTASPTHQVARRPEAGLASDGLASLRVGQMLSVRIDGLGPDGQGLGRYGDTALLVPGGLPSELLRVRLRRKASRHLEADLIEVDERSVDRRRPPCILAGVCGGCSLQHYEDGAQAEFKTNQVAQTIRRIGQLAVPVASTLTATSSLGYRNRALIPLERTKDGVLRAGHYRRGSHRIVNMNRCPVLDPRIDALIRPLKIDLEVSGLPIDVNLTGSNGLRHLALRVGHHTGEVLVTLVSSHDQLPGLEELAKRWQDRWPHVVGVGLNIQPRPNNVVMGPHTHVVRGRDWLLERFADVELRITADTFFQVSARARGHTRTHARTHEHTLTTHTHPHSQHTHTHARARARTHTRRFSR